MQKAQLPEQIFLKRFAESGRSVEGGIPLAGMDRLRDQVLSLEGEARVQLSGGVDPEGRQFLQGHVQAELSVTCQRCLQPMSIAVDTEFSLSPVYSEEEAEALPEAYDPIMLADEDSIELKALVEDELMLSLPVVAVHEPEDCVADTAHYQGMAVPATGVKAHPFAALEKLKSEMKH
ncbi:MAG: DUF177 domain-containing protein [Gammaproteobacteria bacterium]|nr:DUF177 domain-containing protein [Gammaproteobacteria bacterium]